MSLDILKQRIKSKKCGGLYLFCGADEYTKDYYLKALQKEAGLSGFGDFNNIVMNGKGLDVSQLSEALEAYPFMSDLKLITVRSPDIASKPDEKTAAAYRELFSSMPDYAALVFFCRNFEYEYKASKKAPAKTRAGSETLADIIIGYGLAVEFPQPDKFRISSWVQRHFQARNVEITPEAVEYMLMMCGSDLYILSSEIDKLCCGAKDGKLTEKDILTYCCANEEYQTFDLSNAAAEGNVERSLRILKNLTANKTEPLMILGALAKNFSDMLIIKSGVESGLSAREIADKLKMNEWAVNKRISAMRNKSTDYLRYAVKECKECDLKQKSFNTDPYLLLGILVQKLVHKS